MSNPSSSFCFKCLSVTSTYLVGVCKWWRSLIDTTHFILFHLSKSHTTLILHHRFHLYTVDLQSLEKALEITPSHVLQQQPHLYLQRCRRHRLMEPSPPQAPDSPR